jgi:hypothetical protein
MALTGTLTLNGGGDASAVFIFQAGSTLTTASGSNVILENGAQACNIFWQVGSSATLGTTSSMSGTIMALSSATLNTGAAVSGRVLARNGAVTLDDNVINVPDDLDDHRAHDDDHRAHDDDHRTHDDDHQLGDPRRRARHWFRRHRGLRFLPIHAYRVRSTRRRRRSGGGNRSRPPSQLSPPERRRR